MPYGLTQTKTYDQTCTGASAIPPFEWPEVRCQWAPADRLHDVWTTPLVVDLDGDGDPEILVVTLAGELVAIRGKDCTELWRQAGPPYLEPRGSLAVADLDGDGHPEIIAPGDLGAPASKLYVLDHLGNMVASADRPKFVRAGGPGPAIGRIDGGAPVILMGNVLLRYVPGNPQLQILRMLPPDMGAGISTGFLMDLDGDGIAEAVAGAHVYDGATGAEKTPAAISARAFGTASPAVCDFDHDGQPDLVAVDDIYVKPVVASVFSLSGNRFLLGPLPIVTKYDPGLPTIGDFDGDGSPELGIASDMGYRAYSFRCAEMPLPADCVAPGVLWEKSFPDQSSPATGSTSFDFNGDGVKEIVYRDECWLRIFAGPTGETLFAMPMTSGTISEIPVVADVDHDGHADLVVVSGMNGGDCTDAPEPDTGVPWTGPTSGVFVLHDPQDRWIGARPLWNSQSYHVTDINDDLSVPRKEVPFWTTHNSFRRNLELGKPSPAPLSEFTSRDATCGERGKLRASICNRGPAEAGPGVAGTFYSGDTMHPKGKKICTGYTIAPLTSGSCAEVSCVAAPPGPAGMVWFFANDHGDGRNARPECNPDNNRTGVSCGG